MAHISWFPGSLPSGKGKFQQRVYQEANKDPNFLILEVASSCPVLPKAMVVLSVSQGKGTEDVFKMCFLGNPTESY